MLYFIAAVLLVTVTVFLIRTFKRPEQPISKRPAIVMMPIFVVCGNCSGEESTPILTLLDTDKCQVCGGKSFILASNRGAYARRLITTRLSESKASQKGRVLPFEGRQH